MPPARRCKPKLKCKLKLDSFSFLLSALILKSQAGPFSRISQNVCSLTKKPPTGLNRWGVCACPCWVGVQRKHRGAVTRDGRHPPG
jgi:hypothetical protein